MRCFAAAGGRNRGSVIADLIINKLEHPDYPYEFTWGFHDSDEIGPAMLAKIAKRTGLQPEDL